MPEKNPHQCFEMDIEIVTVDPETRGRRGNGHHIVFEAKHPLDAVESAVRLGRRLAGTYREFGDPTAEFCACKVGFCTIRSIDEAGYGGLQHHIPFFEWKFDRPGSLDSYVEEFSASRGAVAAA